MTNTIERWFNKRSLSPFEDFSKNYNPFERLVNELVNYKKNGEFDDFPFTPSCDITEEDKNYMLKLDLPGIKKDHVRVEVDNDQLTIFAERKEEKTSKSKKKYLSELNYGSYTRSFMLPGPVDEKEIEANFKDGVLTISIPKMESTIEKEKKQIPIH